MVICCCVDRPELEGGRAVLEKALITYVCVAWME